MSGTSSSSLSTTAFLVEVAGAGLDAGADGVIAALVVVGGAGAGVGWLGALVVIGGLTGWAFGLRTQKESAMNEHGTDG